MSSQIPGIPASGSSGVAGSTPAGRVSPARALVPVAPTEPRATNPLSGTPLGRSGLDLGELLGTTDTVASRQRTPAVALEVGLEHARGALLRNLAGDALAALDTVWEGARRTEEGWYLRGSALTVLGLPGEGDRIAQEGLETRPASSALRFLQSLARLAVGDVAGARVALQPALQTAPHDPLLLVQQAIVLAKQGDGRGADALLQRAARTAPEHPALDYGRAGVRAATADVTRSVSRATPPVGVMIADVADPFGGAAASATSRPSPPLGTQTQTAPERAGGEYDRATDVADGAIERFGARLVRGEMRDVAREGRLLLRAFTTGGTLVGACSAEQAHAARGVLTTIIGVMLGESHEHAPPLRPMVQQLVVALREGRTVDAERVVRRMHTVAREPSIRLMQVLLRGAMAELAPGPQEDSTAAPTHAFEARLVVQGQAESGPLVPVRLGLALLTETTEQRTAAHGFVAPLSSGAQLAVGWRGDDTTMRDEVTGSYRTVPETDVVGTGWGAAQATAGLHPPRRDDDLRSGAGVRAVALVCVGLAAAAMSTGHSAVAIGLGIGAAWLALRRSSGHGRDHGRGAPSEAGNEVRADHVTEPWR